MGTIGGEEGAVTAGEEQDGRKIKNNNSSTTYRHDILTGDAPPSWVGHEELLKVFPAACESCCCRCIHLGVGEGRNAAFQLNFGRPSPYVRPSIC